MNRRFLTAAIGLALCALAMPASARPYADDDDGDRYARRRHYERYERSYDRDDEEDGGYQRRRRHSRRAVRQRTHAQGARKAPLPEAAKPQQPKQLASAQPQVDVRPLPQLLPLPPSGRHARHDGRGCLRPAARNLLERVESHFGPMQIISTCRPGARIAGSGRISKHASGEAIDFNAGRRKSEVVRWLIANHKSGGTMTYDGMSHIHVDVGYHFVSLNSSSGR